MKSLTHYKHNGHLVHFFRNRESAYRHIRDHLLTYPECLRWNLVNPDKQFEKIFQDDSTYFHHVKTLQEDDTQLFRFLYEYYLDSVEYQMVTAMKLGWASHKTRDVSVDTEDSLANHDAMAEEISEKTQEIVVMMGIAGALILIEGTKEDSYYCVKTVYLGGQGDSRGIVESQLSEKTNSPIRRVFREKKAASNKPSGRKENVEKQEREVFSREKKIYYDVFRTSWQWIRQSYDSYRDVLGNLHGTDFAVLKDIVPKLTFEQWQEKFTPFK